MFELSNRIGRYAVRTRFVEMYLNTGSGKVSSDDYFGIYIFMEKIKRDDERVNVEKLEPWDSTEPRITGGYMLKIDRPDSGDSGFRTSRGNPTYGDGTLCYVDPKRLKSLRHSRHGSEAISTILKMLSTGQVLRTPRLVMPDSSM